MNDLKNVVMEYRKVFIQTHNNPDADAIASAWGMKKLIESFGREAEIIYAGSTIFKPNITKMVNKYRIRMSLIDSAFKISNDEVLIIVDGQYGAGNIMPPIVKTRKKFSKLSSSSCLYIQATS